MNRARREFLGRSGLALGSLALPPALGASAALPPPLAQLYTVRAAMQADVDGTLARVAAIGYRGVELAGLFDRPAREMRALLGRHGLAATSMHVPYAALERWDAALADATMLGCEFVVVPSLPEELRHDLDGYRHAAARLTEGARRARDAGLKFAYHNHDVEFVPLEGRLPFDVLLEATDPGLVHVELDIYWILRGAQDPDRYFNRWPGRVRLLHVKDTGGGPVHAMADVGAGIVDWPRLLAHARAAGAEHFIVEHDSAPDPFASLAASFAYLSRLRPAPPAPRRHRLRQSVARWTFKDVPLPELCRRARAIGLEGIDLLYPDEWAVARDAGLGCSLGYAARREHFIQDGFNDPARHPLLLAELEASIPGAAAAGVPSLIAMFGNRHGTPESADIEACVAGLARIAPLAERHGVNVCVELLNSKVNHPDYAGDHTAFGLAVVQRVASVRVKLLYDIYHMQIMEGDVIRTVQQAIPWIAHFHTGGVPGRHALDDAQELNYHAIARAIAETGFPGFVAHEFVAEHDPFAALAAAFRLFDV